MTKPMQLPSNMAFNNATVLLSQKFDQVL